MTTKEQIIVLVYMSQDHHHPIQQAISNSLLETFDDSSLVEAFFEDFSSIDIDEDDLLQLLGIEPQLFYLKHKDFFNENSVSSLDMKKEIIDNLYTLSHTLGYSYRFK